MPTGGQIRRVTRPGSASPRRRTRPGRPAPGSGRARKSPGCRAIRSPTATITSATGPRSVGGLPRSPVNTAAPRSDRSRARACSVVHRRDRELDVARGLDQHAAEAGQDHRAELRVAEPAHHQLEARAAAAAPARPRRPPAPAGRPRRPGPRPPCAGRAAPRPRRSCASAPGGRPWPRPGSRAARPRRPRRAALPHSTVSITGTPAPASRSRRRAGTEQSARPSGTTAERARPGRRGQASRAAGPGGRPVRRPQRTATPAARAVRSGQAKHGTPASCSRAACGSADARRHPAHVDRHRHAVVAQPGHRVPHRLRHLLRRGRAAAAPAPPRRPRRTGPAARSWPGTRW